MSIPASAFQILKNYHHRRGNLKVLLNRRLKKLDDPSAPVSRLVYGVIRREKNLDWLIARLSRRPQDRLPDRNRLLLRLGLYQLFFSDAVPDHAAVNEIVNLAPEKSRGLVNAMLRNAARRKEALRREMEHLQDPETRYSISPELVRGLEALLGDPVPALAYLNREPVFHLRANTARTSHPALKALLDTLGAEARELENPRCFEIRQPGRVLRPVLETGLGYLQNTGSQLISILAAEFSGQAVLDGCAAPGTKSMTLHLLKPECRLVSADINRKRVRVMDRFHRRCGLSSGYRVVSDMRQPALKNRFDLVLMDAPCSSSGTLRKNPDLKLKIDGQRVAGQVRIQAGILRAILSRFDRSRILYAVCSFLDRETEGLLEGIAGDPPDGRSIEPVDLSAHPALQGFSRRAGKWGTYLLPDDRLNNDLFYLALLENRPA